MALPELTLPAGTPAFLAIGHAIELAPLYADSPMRTGHDRKRRVYTIVPRTVAVGLRLSKAQALAFHEWHEGPLQAAAQEFSAQVAKQGLGLLWWRASFVEPYTAEARPGGFQIITAKLLLTGTGSVDGPYTPDLASTSVIALWGSGVLTVPNDLSSTSVIALAPALFMSSLSIVQLTSIINGAFPSAVDFDKRWIWMRYPYAPGRSADVADTSEADQRSWMGI